MDSKVSNNISRTMEFLEEQFEHSEYMRNNPADKRYRWEHTMRVAHIGRQIAQGDDLDEEILVIGCLLHDLSYVDTFYSEDDWLNHGRRAAELARPFLETLELNAEQIDEICYGIAIHVDDHADFPGERTPLAVSIGDCDNIDRFDVYRIIEALKRQGFLDLPYEEQVEYVAKVLERLKKYKGIEMATKTGTRLWVERISFQIQFFEKLEAQLKSSVFSSIPL
ncbi:MAG: HD domain-containing protein [Firmicutes bacterium]|nr:HD domain-containing protein [Bacillota bacterium]